MRLTRGLIYAVLACILSFVSCAYAELVKGRDYSVIEPAQPVSSGRKIEVLEFFWYGCPHCNRLKPHLNAWLKRKPADADFKRVPAAFRESWLPLARAHYALQALGLADKLHGELFAAIHDRKTLDIKTLAGDPAPLFDWMAAKGVDRKQFADAYNSPAVAARTRSTIETTGKYALPDVPAVVINGRYLIALSMAGYSDGDKKNYDLLFRNIDQLIAQARRDLAQK
ncbi:MAG TPA: thiol:disulfide interchange protein DsbA/DsbL [Burkholderiales bacterium]